MAEKTETSTSKSDALTRALFDEYVLVHVNPRHEGVRLPPHSQKFPTVTLKISKFFKYPIELTKQGISARLRFGDDYFSCSIPLAAIWGATTVKGETLMWPEELPEALRNVVAHSAPGQNADTASAPSPPKSEKPRGHLKLVK